MRRNLTYPKDDSRKLREENRQLRTQVSRLRKENSVLRGEIENIMKPVRLKKEQVEDKDHKVLTQEEWRRDFVKRCRPILNKRLKGTNGNED